MELKRIQKDILETLRVEANVFSQKQNLDTDMVEMLTEAADEICYLRSQVENLADMERRSK